MNAIIEKIKEDIKDIKSQWYSNSRKLIKELSEMFRLKEELIAGIIAITSIRTSVRKNLYLSLLILNNLNKSDDSSFIDQLPCLNLVKRKLKEYLKTHEFPKGDKINSFFNVLTGKQDIVVDIWIQRYFRNEFNIKNKKQIKAIIREIANSLHVNPALIQERIWIKSKLKYGRNSLERDIRSYYEIYHNPEKEGCYENRANRR